MTREEARTFLQKWLDEMLNSVRCDNSAEWCEAIDMAIEELSEPQIIRCKDCKYYKSASNGLMGCEITQYLAHDDDFCSWAEGIKE